MATVMGTAAPGAAQPSVTHARRARRAAAQQATLGKLEAAYACVRDLESQLRGALAQLAAVQGQGEIGDRMKFITPVLAARLQCESVGHPQALLRNVAEHVTDVPMGQLAVMSCRQLNALQRRSSQARWGRCGPKGPAARWPSAEAAPAAARPRTGSASTGGQTTSTAPSEAEEQGTKAMTTSLPDKSGPTNTDHDTKLTPAIFPQLAVGARGAIRVGGTENDIDGTNDLDHGVCGAERRGDEGDEEAAAQCGDAPTGGVTAHLLQPTASDPTDQGDTKLTPAALPQLAVGAGGLGRVGDTEKDRDSTNDLDHDGCGAERRGDEEGEEAAAQCGQGPASGVTAHVLQPAASDPTALQEGTKPTPAIFPQLAVGTSGGIRAGDTEKDKDDTNGLFHDVCGAERRDDEEDEEAATQCGQTPAGGVTAHEPPAAASDPAENQDDTKKEPGPDDDPEASGEAGGMAGPIPDGTQADLLGPLFSLMDRVTDVTDAGASHSDMQCVWMLGRLVTKKGFPCGRAMAALLRDFHTSYRGRAVPAAKALARRLLKEIAQAISQATAQETAWFWRSLQALANAEHTGVGTLDTEEAALEANLDTLSRCPRRSGLPGSGGVTRAATHAGRPWLRRPVGAG